MILPRLPPEFPGDKIIRLGTDDSWAIFSTDQVYRYALCRTWPGASMPNKFVTWCMLNPSTADHEVLDPTLRRCEGFSKHWGYGGMYIVNAYAFRATDPKNLPRGRDKKLSAAAIGRHNDEQIAFWCSKRDVVLGWGANCDPDRANYLISVAFRDATDVCALDINADGSPKHPLYISRDKSTVRYPPNPSEEAHATPAVRDYQDR